MGWMLEDSRFDSRRGKTFFFLSKASRGSPWFTHPPLTLTPEAIPLVAERLVREAGQYSCTPPHVFVAWCLIKTQGQLCSFIMRRSRASDTTALNVG
jgi:hypothetical protein